jgi:hypothetical protein
MSARAADGTPLPWYTYPAIDFLARRDFRNCDVLEFGGKRVHPLVVRQERSVLTIERDAAWFAPSIRSGPMYPATFPSTADANSPTGRGSHRRQSGRKFDIIVVDGHLHKKWRHWRSTTSLRRYHPRQFRGYGFYDEIRNAPVVGSISSALRPAFPGGIAHQSYSSKTASFFVRIFSSR